MPIHYSQMVMKMLDDAEHLCRTYRHEYCTAEHCLMALFKQDEFVKAASEYCDDIVNMKDAVRIELRDADPVPEDYELDVSFSVCLHQVLLNAANIASAAGRTVTTIPHIVKSMTFLGDDSVAACVLTNYIPDECFNEFMSRLVSYYNDIEIDYDGIFRGEEDFVDDDEDFDDGEMDLDKPSSLSVSQWRELVTDISAAADDYNPLVGREAELERTIQVLCRKEKNNVLHIGEPGVGKTALIYGLARMINEDKVPDKLRGFTIYQIDMGSILAGTQFRGDFEKRIKQIMDGLAEEGSAIVYIDEIHNVVGLGNTNDGSLDASDMIKPYMESGKVRFIGSTTYEEYNRRLSKKKTLIHRFQQIDIAEPSTDEAIRILMQLKPRYEQFHGVKYADKAIEFAVTASAKHINERCLPDKAIDLIDEAGAYRVMHPLEQKKQTVDKALIAEILSKVCKVDALAMKEDDNAMLKTLAKRILSQIYGQDEAVRQLVEAVQMSKAGLTDDNKPLASLLFVGPTGVGKTEVARVLAQEMGIELVRFDMSEYTEKHTVAKLIGSPAGYVGYEDGGLLTDAMRKTPNCVLLLDEIEKAHEDIYNILLQVMDYARLTDNKGRKADFRNVVLIMTSNAGAQYAAQANIGFDRHVSASEAMMKQVKKTFKPEFINRLSGTVMFNDMDRTMASLILDKKLRLLQDKLSVHKVELALDDDARNYLLDKGFTREYGARELDRVIANELKPMLMREILFGKLKRGGKVRVVTLNNVLHFSPPSEG